MAISSEEFCIPLPQFQTTFLIVGMGGGRQDKFAAGSLLL